MNKPKKTAIEYEKSYINVDDVKNEIKKLNIPKEYFKIDLDAFFRNEYNMYLSIRENAGKTTQSLILGLVLWKLYSTKTEYIRNDETQTARSSIEDLYDTVESLGYIRKLFNGKYTNVEYSVQQKCFRLIKLDDDGKLMYRSEPFCAVHSNEMWKKYKSSYNSPKGDFIVFDEIFDTERPTYRSMTEFMNNISTIGRVGSKQRRNNVHVLMLGNNTDEYSHWWDDFTIADKIKDLLDFGASFETTTDLGSTVYCKLIDLNDNKKEEIENKKIKFFGFNTPEMAQFNGTQVWAHKSYPQIPDVEMLEREYKKYNKIYIHHRDRYIQLDLYRKPENGYYVFLHWAKEPKKNDCLILTATPIKKNEVYGFGRYNLSDKTYKILSTIYKLKCEQRWYYLNNKIGNIVEDFEKNSR